MTTLSELLTAVHHDPCCWPILHDHLLDMGFDQHKAAEALPYLPPSRYLPIHYYGIGIGSGSGSGHGSGSVIGRGHGSGRGSGSGRGRGGIGIGSDEGVIVMETGKVYLVETVDWFAFVGRVVRQVGPWEYEFASCSKIANTNNQDNWHELAAGNAAARKACTYRHYTTPVILGMGAVVKIEWAGNTPQEDGL